MDLIEKFCCWKYIFFQMNAVYFQVPNVCECMWILTRIYGFFLLCTYHDAQYVLETKMTIFCEWRSVSHIS